MVEVKINGLVLPIAEGARDLGLVLDNSFSPREQIGRYIGNREPLILSRLAYYSVHPAIDSTIKRMTLFMHI